MWHPGETNGHSAVRKGLLAATVVAVVGALTIAVSSAVSSPSSFAVAPSEDLTGPVLATVTATGVAESTGVSTPLGTVWSGTLLQCDGSVASLEPDVASIGEVVAFAAEVDALCTELADDVVVDGNVVETVTVRQPFLSGGTTPLPATPGEVDCSVNGCVVVLVGASGDFNGFDGSVTIETFAISPIDFLPTVRLGAIETAEGTGSNTTVDLPLTLSEPLGVDVSFGWGLAGTDGSGSVGSDVVDASGIVMIPAGATTGAVSVEVVGDDFDELPIETVRVVITDVPPEVPHVAGGGLVTILDDDEPLRSIAVDPVVDLRTGDELSVRAEGVVDTGGLDGELAPSYRPAIYQCAGPFGDQQPDELPSSGNISLLFDLWQSCRPLTPESTPVNGVLEASVAVVPTFESVGSPINAGFPVDCRSVGCGIAVLALSGDPFAFVIDTFEWVEIEFVPEIRPGATPAVEGDTGTTEVQVPIRLSGPIDEPVTVSFETAGNAANPFVAVPDVDYVSTSGTVTFAPGQTEAFVPVQVIGDNDFEESLLWGEWGVVAFGDVAGPAELDTATFFGAGLFIIRNDDEPLP